MTSSDLHAALLRPAVIQVLQALGFGRSKPAVVDTFADLTGRYLLRLATETKEAAINSHGDYQPNVQDVRLALQIVGALRPQMNATEEAAKGLVVVDGIQVPFEDLRGIRNFVAWAEGPVNKEIRRVGGFEGDSEDIDDIAAGMSGNEDYVTAIKRKNNKSGEESRYQGTMLGKDSEPQLVAIAGGPVASLSDWNEQRMRDSALARRSMSPVSSTISSALSTPIDPTSPPRI